MDGLRDVKLCLLGDEGVGKTSMVQRFVLDSYQIGTEPTIGASFMSKILDVEGKSYRYQIWDTAGQEKYRTLAPMYYRGAAAVIIVYDITSERSYKSVQSWIRELRERCTSDVVIAIAGNKADLEELREVSTDEATLYCEDIGSVFMETSARTASGVDEIFEQITYRLPSLSNPLSTLERRSQRDTVGLHQQDQESSSCRPRC